MNVVLEVWRCISVSEEPVMVERTERTQSAHLLEPLAKGLLRVYTTMNCDRWQRWLAGLFGAAPRFNEMLSHNQHLLFLFSLTHSQACTPAFRPRIGGDPPLKHGDWLVEKTRRRKRTFSHCDLSRTISRAEQECSLNPSSVSLSLPPFDSSVTH